MCCGVSSILRVFWVSSHVPAKPNWNDLGNLCSWKPRPSSISSFISVTVGGSTPKAVGSALWIQVLPSFVQVISVFKNVIECWLFNAKYWLCSHLLCTPTPCSPYSCAAPKAFGVKFCVWGVLWSTGLWRWEYFLWWSAEGYFHLSCVALGGGGRLFVREIFYINILHKLTRFSLREPFISHHHPEFLLIHIPAQTTSFLCKQQEGQKEEEC